MSINGLVFDDIWDIIHEDTTNTYPSSEFERASMRLNARSSIMIKTESKTEINIHANVISHYKEKFMLIMQLAGVS